MLPNLDFTKTTEEAKSPGSLRWAPEAESVDQNQQKNVTKNRYILAV